MKSLSTKVFGFLAGVVFAASAASAQDRLTIGTAGTGGALYPMGVAMAETFNRHSEVAASAEASAASLENLRNLSTGDIDWGISANDIAYQAYHGQGIYEGRPIGELRSLFGTVSSWVQVFTLADSDVTSLADVAGLRVGVGAAGSGGEQAANNLLKYYGLSYDDVEEQFMGESDMVAALQDGALDVLIITHPLRSAPLMELTTASSVKMIPVTDEGFYAENPYFVATEVPGGTYDGVEPVTTPVSRIVMYTSANGAFSDDQIYELLALLWDNAAEWQSVHAAVTKSTTLDKALVGLDGIPLHPAAIRFYEDRGLTVPDSMR